MDKPLVLIVEDTTTNIDILVSTLKSRYSLGIAKNGSTAIDYAAKHLPDLILLDIMMPEMDGHEVCKILKKNPLTKGIPVIFITAMSDQKNKTRGFDLGAVDYITKPFHGEEIIRRIQTHIDIKKMGEELRDQNVILEMKVDEKTADLQTLLETVIDAFALIVEIQDPYTAGHQQRVARLSTSIAREMGLEKGQRAALRFAGVLHDIGKIRIPASILSRPGELLETEFELIKTHSRIGFDILKRMPFPWRLADIVLQHHERLDGSGYPRGLTGGEILIEAGIIAVADVTEAMSAHRPYRAALGMDAAMEVLKKGKGAVFDPEVVGACLKLIKEDGFKFG